MFKPAIQLLVLITIAQSQSAQSVGAARRDVPGWGNTRWGMSESEVKRVVHGRWRTATKEERDEDSHMYMPFVLRDVKIGGQDFIGLFGFDRTHRKLIRVTLHSGTLLIRPEEAVVIFERRVDELQHEWGPPGKIVRGNSGHTGVYEHFAVWRFPGSVIDLFCLRPNDAGRAVVLSYSQASEADR